jgi:N-acetylmuramoyl-L-alanine amidase
MFNLRHWFTALAACGLSLASPLWTPPSSAAVFDNQRVDERRFVLLASPFGVEKRSYQLLIVEQLSNQRPCWREYDGEPTRVDPLLFNFDFSDICSRLTDSNGYSLRIGSEDLGWRFILSVVPQGGELVLMANSPREPNVRIPIGRTRGLAEGYLKIHLDEGWELTRRTYRSRPLGHIYLTGDPQVVSVPSGGPVGINSSPLPSDSLPPADREIIITPLPPRTAPVPQPPQQRPLPTPPANPTPSDRPLPPPERRIPTF